MRTVSAALALFAFWVVMSGYFTPFLLTVGAVASVLVVLFARRLDVVDPETHPPQSVRVILAYWPWLAWEIVKSAWDVSKVILSPRLPISPTIVRVRPSQKSDVGRVIYANSITLTPGTVTIVAGRDEFIVHAITRAGAESLAGGDMDRRVSRVEGGA
jgi:multicomponent Na+:H+ antiporter subunit E